VPVDSSSNNFSPLRLVCDHIKRKF
jgi:hypothetical protein